MNSDKIIEGTPYLSTSSIKRDFLRCRKKVENISGDVYISYGIKSVKCNYWFEYRDKSTFFVISIDGNDPQDILLSERELMCGTMSYFVCECGKQCLKLFLPLDQTKLKCRACHGLTYELSTINRSSKHGLFLYRTNRTLKLADQRAEINRIFYKSQYTKRFQRFLRLCTKAGLHKNAEDAQKFIKAIQEQ